MKLKTTTGKYAIEVSGEILPAKLAELAELGLAQGVLYRGVFAELRELTGAKRKLEDSAAFDAGKAKLVMEAITKALAPYVPDHEIAVTEYVGGEPAALKYKAEREKASAHESAGDLEAWLAAKVGFTGETHGADGEFSREMLHAIKVKVDEIAKAAAKAAGL